jgi:hypothetical protein
MKKESVSRQLSLVDRIMQYESGLLEPEQVVELFQKLVDTGMVWDLQGSYGREAKRLIDAGLVEPLHVTQEVDEDY